MNERMLEFLFAGPLFSIFKGINQIRKDIMGLKDQIDGYTTQVDSFANDVAAARTEFAQELKDLTDKLNAAGAVDPDVQASLDNLGNHIGTLGDSLDSLKGAEVPSVPAGGDSTPTPGGGVIVDPGTLGGGIPASDSPGEPSTGTTDPGTDENTPPSTPSGSDSTPESGSTTTEVTPEENV